MCDRNRVIENNKEQNNFNKRKELSQVFNTLIKPNCSNSARVIFGNELDNNSEDYKLKKMRLDIQNQFEQDSRFETDFTFLEKQGSGNFGSVLKCQNRLDGLIYAIKISAEFVKKSQIKIALNEAIALASVNALNELYF